MLTARGAEPTGRGEINQAPVSGGVAISANGELWVEPLSVGSDL